MSALELAAPPAPLSLPGQRGRTTISDRVVARIAARAVTEAGQGTPRVSARVDGNLAVIEVRLTLVYPVPVRSLTREVRRHVIERVASLAGIEVRHVDIEVARLLRGWQR